MTPTMAASIHELRTLQTLDTRIAHALDATTAADDVEATLRALVAAGLDRLPYPADGRTRERWRCLARVAAADLALVKLYEGHTDALAILAELEGVGADRPRGRVYGVWASESPVEPVTIVEPPHAFAAGMAVTVSGRKSWCSGARLVDAALMTARDGAGGRWLVEIALDAGGVAIDETRWHAVGMARSQSFDVVCDGVEARLVGGANAYLHRPGFWHGGAGIAACWHGAAAAVGDRVRALQRGRNDAHALAHLGVIDALLAASAASLRECADAIDRDPRADAMHRVLRVRTYVADAALEVVRRAERAMGPGPFCNDLSLARLVADLPIFVRQARAEHDAGAQARSLVDRDDVSSEWTL